MGQSGAKSTRTAFLPEASAASEPPAAPAEKSRHADPSSGTAPLQPPPAGRRTSRRRDKHRAESVSAAPSTDFAGHRNGATKAPTVRSVMASRPSPPSTMLCYVCADGIDDAKYLCSKCGHFICRQHRNKDGIFHHSYSCFPCCQASTPPPTAAVAVPSSNSNTPAGKGGHAALAASMTRASPRPAPYRPVSPDSLTDTSQRVSRTARFAQLMPLSAPPTFITDAAAAPVSALPSRYTAPPVGAVGAATAALPSRYVPPPASSGIMGRDEAMVQQSGAALPARYVPPPTERLAPLSTNAPLSSPTTLAARDSGEGAAALPAKWTRPSPSSQLPSAPSPLAMSTNSSSEDDDGAAPMTRDGTGVFHDDATSAPRLEPLRDGAVAAVDTVAPSAGVAALPARVTAVRPTASQPRA